MSFSDYLDDELMDKKETNGAETRYKCPFCMDDKYRLYVNTSDGERDGRWICFKCGRKGNPVSYVMQASNVDFKTAKDMLEIYGFGDENFTREASDRGLTVEEYLVLQMMEQEKPLEDKPEEQLVPPPLPVGYKRIVDNLGNPEVRPFLEYLVHKRGYTDQDIMTHNIGYITEGHAFSSTGKQVNIRNQVVFLTHDDEGRYQYWNTRSIEKEPYIKSLNGMSKDGEYSKRTVMFNLNLAKHYESLVLVEGVTDALTVGSQGIASFGKQVTDEQVKLLLASLKPAQKLYIMLDRDADKQASNLADKLYPKHNNTYVVINPTGRDANDLGHEKTWEVINNHSVIASPENISLLFL